MVGNDEVYRLLMGPQRHTSMSMIFKLLKNTLKL
jgi:hypothetical protein